MSETHGLLKMSTQVSPELELKQSSDFDTSYVVITGWAKHSQWCHNDGGRSILHRNNPPLEAILNYCTLYSVTNTTPRITVKMTTLLLENGSRQIMVYLITCPTERAKAMTPSSHSSEPQVSGAYICDSRNFAIN